MCLTETRPDEYSHPAETPDPNIDDPTLPPPGPDPEPIPEKDPPLDPQPPVGDPPNENSPERV